MDDKSPTINISKWSFSHFSTDFSKPAIDTNDLAFTTKNIFIREFFYYLFRLLLLENKVVISSLNRAELIQSPALDSNLKCRLWFNVVIPPGGGGGVGRIVLTRF